MLKQHEDKYRDTLLDVIRNNTNGLVEQDLVSLLKKPPLDSMDLLRTKLLDIAKKNKVVFNTEKLDSFLEKYRSYLLDCCEEISKVRVSSLNHIIMNAKIKEMDIIKINKKDFTSINKEIKNILKNRLKEGYHTVIFSHIDDIFVEIPNEIVHNKIVDEYTKYVNGFYQKQLLENFELKIMVKDTTLMNIVKEQGERYLFTLKHSHLLNEVDA